MNITDCISCKQKYMYRVYVGEKNGLKETDILQSQKLSPLGSLAPTRDRSPLYSIYTMIKIKPICVATNSIKRLVAIGTLREAE